MQTAVEWLTSQFANIDENRKAIFEQAKEMEKQQIEDSFDKGFGWNYSGKKFNGKEYYNETFNK
jgi:hypothetical protein